MSSWNFNPPVRALDSLVELIGQSFAHPAETCTSAATCSTCSAASISKGTSEPRSWRFLRDIPTCGCLQFAAALEERLLSIVTVDELEQLRKESDAELGEPGR